MAKKSQEPAAMPGMGHDQLAMHVRKTVERALGTTVEMGAMNVKLKDNELTLKLELTASDVRIQLLPFEEKKDTTAMVPQDDLASDS